MLGYVLLFLVYFTLLLANCEILKPILKNGSYNEDYTLAVNNYMEYIIQFDNSKLSYPSRITVETQDAYKEAPVMVVVRQQKEVLSWQLPLVVDNELRIPFMRTSRTLCPDDIPTLKRLPTSYVENGNVALGAVPVVSISTSSLSNVTFTLRLEMEMKFYLNASTEYNIIISPSEPRYYYYNFPKNKTIDGPYNLESVVLEINSYDDICMIVSIQNSSCPVYDLNHDVKFEGFWETVSRKGGMTITKDDFPFGFFIVFTASGDDQECGGSPTPEENIRHKNLTFTIKPSIAFDDYVIAVTTTVASIVLFYVIFIILFAYCSRQGYRPRAMEFVDERDAQTVQDAITPTSTLGPDFLADNMSFDETEYDTIAEAEFDKEIILGKPVVFLSDLARKDPRILKRKSYLYLYHVLTVALFYGLPVVQLVITYQKVLNNTGNQDLCYYNFLCAHPFGFFSDFNHIFSNIGYILFGFLFILLVYRRELQHNDTTFDKYFGIPQHYGLFYAMGVALIMEGVLSGSYHICPNHSNFQFDSSFMYVMAVLCMVKLYQTRHPDINATAYATFGVLAIAILLGMIGILEANLVFWIAFTILHIIVCLVLTAQVYYLGCWKLDRGLILRVVRVFAHDFMAGSFSVLKPVHKGRMVLLVLGNVCNWALAVLGIYNHDRDFATYLLGVFMANTSLYFTFYCVMKLLHKERINVQALMYLVLALSCACSAMYFFTNKSISWALTPAQSRLFNQECKLLRFYDFHDIWHFLSGAGMFFTFMLLLTLDDDVSHTSRTKINVF